LRDTVPFTARQFARALVMPNLQPPMTDTDGLGRYRERILAAVPAGVHFEPLMTLYLTDTTTAAEIGKAAAAGFVVGAKLYPAGATTHSDAGVSAIDNVWAALEALAERGLVLQVHGEVTTPAVDVFDREARFIDEVLQRIVERVPVLKVVFEHVTTATAVDFVRSARAGVGATITPQHLLLNRNALFTGGIRPHHYCLPVLKRERDREALLEAATSDDARFFLGTDSAPHARHAKETACGCAGIFSAHAALEFYCRSLRPGGTSRPSRGVRGAARRRFLRCAAQRRRASGCDAKPWTVPDHYAFGAARGGAAARRSVTRLAVGHAVNLSPEVRIVNRFRGFLPVVIDVETGGFNAATDALLELAAVMIEMTPLGTLRPGPTLRYHIQPFHGSRLDPASLAITGIDPHHPLRPAMPEKEALAQLFREVRRTVREAECTRGNPGRAQRGVRSGVPERGCGAHGHQAQSVSPVLDVRHGHAGRRGPTGRRCCRGPPSAAGHDLGQRPRRTPPSMMPSARRSSSAPVCNRFRSLFEEGLQTAPQLDADPAAAAEPHALD
jgi:dihydroorotase